MSDQDILHTTEIMRAALPYIDAHNKVMVELIMRVLELVGFIRTFRKSLSLAACGYEAARMDLEGMLNSIKPVCNKKERDFIDKILNIFNMKRAMEMYNQMMDVMNAMQQDSDVTNPDESVCDASAPETYTSGEITGLLNFYKSDMETADSEGENTNAHDSPDSSEEKTGDDFISESSDGNQPGKSSSSGLINDKMLDMLKAIIPPEQRSKFDNLSMLLTSMSYDNTSNPDEDKEQEING